MGRLSGRPTIPPRPGTPGRGVGGEANGLHCVALRLRTHNPSPPTAERQHSALPAPARATIDRPLSAPGVTWRPIPCSAQPARAARTLTAALLLALPASALAQGVPAPPTTPPGAESVLPNTAFPELPAPPSPPPPPDQPAAWPPPQPAPAAPPTDGALLSPFANAPWANPAVGRVPYAATYRITWLPDESVSGQAARFGIVEQVASVRFPIWQTDRDELSGNVHVQAQLINTGAILPSTDQPFPDQLWDVRFGVGYRHLFENGWIAGGNFSFGSASNLPFNSVNELTAGVNAFLRIPSGERNAWLFSLSYSPTGELSFPIPGVAYAWVPNDEFRMNVGLPFMVWYRPIEDLTLEASYMLLTTVHARATYRVCTPVRVYARLRLDRRELVHRPAPDDKDRLFYYEQRLSVGADDEPRPDVPARRVHRLRLQPHLLRGADSFNDRNFNRVDVDAAPLLSLQAQLRW